jgi:aspartyl-tRNA(Asn)/glutamyl-tRNA(Gln) amidotransferase subunit A
MAGFIDKLKKEGHTVQPLSFSLTEYIVPAYYILTTAEASSNLSRYDGIRFGSKKTTAIKNLSELYKVNRTTGFGKEVKRRIMLGTFVLSSGYFEAYFTQAQLVRQQLVNHINLIFNDFDFILAPNSPTIAPSKGQQLMDPVAMYLGDIFTVFANLTGAAAASLPVFKHSSNLPFGLQLLCSPQNEVSLLRFTHHLMQQ